MDALRLVLGNVDAARFFSCEWGARPRVLPGPDGRFADLFDWQEFVGILEARQVDLAYPRIRFVREGEVLGESESTVAVPHSLSGSPARLSAAKVNGLCANGTSIVLSGIRDYSPRLRAFAVQIEERLRCPVSVNAYYTPAGGRAFRVHYDPYDVFILQVLGEKRWRLYGLRTPSPLLDDRASFRNAPEQPEEELTLREGEALYIPRGWWHAASTSAEAGSLHLTVGVRSHTYVDLLRRLLETLKDSDEARERLPLAVGEHGPVALDHGGILAALDELLRQARAAAPGALEELEGAVEPAECGFAIPRPR